MTLTVKNTNFFSMLKSLNHLKATFFLILIIFVTLVSTGFKKFIVWDQIIDHYKMDLMAISDDYYCKSKTENALRSKNTVFKLARITDDELTLKCQFAAVNTIKKTSFDEDDFNQTAHYHRVRLLILKPIIRAATLTGLNVHSLFTWACVILIFAMAFLLSLKEFKLSMNKFWFFCAAIICISMGMNGRNLISFLGLSFIIYAMSFTSMESKKNRLIFLTSVAFAMLFSNVSSGVNTFILVFFIMWLWLNRKIFINFPLISAMLLAAILLGQLFWVLTGLSKNISFYGGDIFISPFLMLQHGVGKYLFSPESVIMAVILGLFYFKYKAPIHAQKKKLHLFQRTHILGSVLCLVAGLFGYSILSLSIIFSLLLASDLLPLSIQQK